MNSQHDVEILLVEDDPNDAALTLRAFQARNLTNQVFVARDGAEALDFFFGDASHPWHEIGIAPKVILLDLNLPKVGGLEVSVAGLGCNNFGARGAGHRGSVPAGREQLHREAGGLRGVLAGGVGAGAVLGVAERAAAVMAAPLRILLAEDVPDDAALMEQELRRAGLAITTRRVES